MSGTVHELLQRGADLLSQRQFDEAEACWLKALQAEPGNGQIVAVLARLYMNQRRLTEAVTLVQSALQQEGGPQPVVLHAFGLLCHHTGDPAGLDAAIGILESVAFDPDKIAELRALKEKTVETTLAETRAERDWAADEIAIFCGPTGHTWSPRSLARGVGGSEEAVIRLGRCLAAEGWKVTVFANVGEEAGDYDGVSYQALDHLNIRDQFNVVVLWRSIQWVDSDFRARQTYVWLHDLPETASFTRGRVDRVTGIMVLSAFHRSTLPHVPDEKFVITANGIDQASLEPSEPQQRNPKRCLYASSYERGLEALLEMWPAVLDAVPDAEVHVFYGWHGFESRMDDPEVAAWVAHMKQLMQQPGVHEHGRVSQQRIIDESYAAGVLAYPSTFEETSCITAMKAQACGAVPVVWNLAALAETVRWGACIEAGDREAYLQALIGMLQDPDRQEQIREEMIPGARAAFSWQAVAAQWSELFSQPTLSVCMIARNEAERIGRCLASVTPVADEVIVLDTGSTDNTIEIATRAGARVEHLEWPDDFAAARNHSLSLATGDWILVIDADEVLDEAAVAPIRRAIAREDVHAFRLLQRNFKPEGEVSRFDDTPLTRLFRNDERFRYEQPIHEQILPSIKRAGGHVEDSTWVLLHDGYMSETVQGGAKRAERNLRLLAGAAAKRPRDPYLHYQLGVTYKSLQDFERAEQHLLLAERIGMQNEVPEARIDLETTLAQLALARNDYAEADRRASTVLEQETGHVVATFVRAVSAMYSGQFARALPALESLMSSDRCHPSMRPQLEALRGHCLAQAA
ncbi:MAG: glycosyltransferase [Rhodothermales bacterium]|nr:glycosyltransferase [Rhodothermales bacterium]MBO6778305.1 glycosyltransferase [Rhodothermales bacterium]